MDGGRTGPAGVGLGPVLVTRPEPEASAWVEVLRSQGFAARAWPLIEIGSDIMGGGSNNFYPSIVSPLIGISSGKSR